MSKITWSLVVVAVLAVGSLAVAASPAADPAAQAACVKVFERERACTDTFIPALVDLRISIDKPAGMAEAAKKEGRERFIAVALEEWKGDSTDAAIAKTCAMISASPKAPAMVTASEKCVKADTCLAFTDCVIPVLRTSMR